MNLKQAMAIVYDLANENALDETFENDEVLSETYNEQQEALEIVSYFINSETFKSISYLDLSR